ncbi:MAG: YidC/Oxa1 family membrane protein insertase [Actinomycetota bacterium]|nr:YidC/Oxa1 family membrane protein insertase [Actinomycetota bacterium]
MRTIGQIFQPILRGIGDVLAFFYALIPNYPVDIALLTVAIMALLTPLTVRATKYQVKMQDIAPEMKKLQAKYKGADNRMQLQEEMMKLYKEYDVSPVGGCLPLLLQMPAFFALYEVIRGITNTVTTVHVIAGEKITKVAAAPRYISPSSKMYHDIVASHGKLNAFGMDFAQKLFSHRGSIFAYLPYALLVLAAIGLQYLQMARLNARNPQAAQANPQMAAMQKYMPIIFGIIYLNIPAIINVYFIVSSAIRLGTQEVLFHQGIGPGAAARKAAQAERKLPKGGEAEVGPPPAKPSPAKPGPKRSPATGAEKPGAKGAGSKGSGAGAREADASRNGATGRKAGADGGEQSEGADGTGAKPKSHPRSKSKRERRDR